MFIHDYVLADHRKEYLTTTELNLQSYRSIKKKKKEHILHQTLQITFWFLLRVTKEDILSITTAQHRRSTQLSAAPQAGLGRGIEKGDMGCLQLQGVLPSGKRGRVRLWIE